MTRLNHMPLMYQLTEAHKSIVAIYGQKLTGPGDQFAADLQALMDLALRAGIELARKDH